MKTVTLREITLNITDGKHGDCEPAENSGYYFVSCKDVNNGTIDYANARQISERAFLETHKRTQLEPNDILITNSGTIGRMALVKDIPETYRTTFQKSVAIVKPDISVVLPTYLYYKLQNCVTDFVNCSNGSAQKNLLLGTMRKFQIDLHEDFAEQERLSSILAAYDNLIENNQKQIKLLEEAAQRLYKEWFVDLRFPGYEDTPIVDGVPEGWEIRPSSDVFTFIRGKSYTSKELSNNQGTLMVNLKNISAFGGYNRNAEKRFTGKYKEEQQLTPGDIIMGVTDMTQERRLVGHTAMVPDLKEKMTFSMDLIKLIPISVSKNYLYGTMLYGGFSYKISPLANGVNVLHLKPEAIMNLPILVPSSSVMEAFDNVFNPICFRIESLQEQIDVASEARDRLLPKLMSGKIEV